MSASKANGKETARTLAAAIEKYNYTSEATFAHYTRVSPLGSHGWDKR